MFTHPDWIGQLARQHHRQMLAEDGQPALRHQPGHRSSLIPPAAVKITRRLAAMMTKATVMADG